MYDQNTHLFSFFYEHITPCKDVITHFYFKGYVRGQNEFSPGNKAAVTLNLLRQVRNDKGEKQVPMSAHPESEKPTSLLY